MDEKLDKLIRLLIDNGISLNRVGDWFCCTELELDFSEHDKVFEDKIAKLKQQIRELIKEKDEYKRKCNDFGFENQDLKKITKSYEDKIAELEKEVVEWKAEAKESKKNRDEQLKSVRKAVEPYVDIGHMHETIADKNKKIAELEKAVVNYKQSFKDKCADYGVASELLGKYQQENEALEKRIQELDKIDTMRIDEKRELKQHIAELEIKNKQLKHGIDKMAEIKSKWIDRAVEWQQKCEKLEGEHHDIGWYDNRHQSDCIEINRLNTTIDVLIHKVEYLRQFAGSE